MSSPTVTVIHCTHYNTDAISNAIERQFQLLGGIENFVRRGDTVLLKPNLIAPKHRRYAAQTDPAVIIETARLLKDFGAKPFVGDSSAWGNAVTCIRALGLEEPLKKLSVPVKQLDKPKICRVGRRNIAVGISSVAMEADVIINLPKFKSHQQLVATFALKNMFGCVSGKRKTLWHFRRGKKPSVFCELLIDIYRYINPALTIIDAVVAMDGPGPIRGRARPLGWIIGGTDPIACEMICAKLIGIEPMDVPIIETAGKMGFGCTDPAKIRVAGDDFSGKVCTDFKLPELVPIRFSLPHVCKSIFTQIYLVAGSKIKKRKSRD